MIIPGDIIKGEISRRDNSPAIITLHSVISNKEISKLVKQTSAWLSSIGIREHTKAALLSSNSPDYVVLISALWNLNACIIPLNIMLSDSELTELINFSDAEFLFYGNDEKRNLDVKIPRFNFNMISTEAADVKVQGLDPDAISLVMFTSGATGKPKGVMHSLNDLLNSADNSQDLLNQKPGDRWLASLPFYHIGGLSIIIRALRYGSPLIIPSSLKNDSLVQAFDSLKPSFASLVSTQLKRMLESGWRPSEELKNILLGGGFADEELIKEAAAAGCPISNVYGSTETSAFITAGDPDSVKSKPLSAGRALGRSKVLIVDDQLNEEKKGHSGEILIKSTALFHGYYKDEKETSKKLKPEGFLTGDVGYIDDDGDLFVAARRTDLIITGGENVNPIEVETALNKMPGIGDSCVFALPDKEWGQIVAAAVVLKADVSIQEITGYLKERIAGYKIPKRYFPVEIIPRSPLGKILREKVRGSIEN